MEIQSAYEILSDEQKRAKYDQFGHAGDGGGFNPNPGYNSQGGFGQGGFNGFGQGGFGNLEDILRGFAGFGGQPQQTLGDDILARTSITFLEAAHGVTKNINYRPVVKCSPCSGSGTKKGIPPKTCPQCRGTGQAVFARGGFHMASTCPSCQGRGTVISAADKCTTCGGQGRVRESKTLEVKIPAGIDDGMRVRLAGQGDYPLEGSGKPGDLLIQVQVF